MKRVVAGLLCMLLASVGLVQAAELTHVAGQVELLAADGTVRKLAKAGDEVAAGESVRALANGKAMIRQDGGRYTVVTANSQVKIEESGVVEQVRGAVYYVLRKLSSSESNKQYSVKTSVATIGIRGTRFLVVVDGDTGEVVLTEGLINMTANEGKSFEIEKYPGDMTFEEFRKAQDKLFKGFLKDDFQAWRKNEMKEFESFKQQFFVQPNQSVSIDGGKVRYQDIAADDAALVAELDALVREFEEDLGTGAKR